METGFSSTRYLNAMFQKTNGCSAREYRAMKQRPKPLVSPLPTRNSQMRYSFDLGRTVFFSLVPEEDGTSS